MTKTEQLLAYARKCLGTPFHHQARVAGIGLDCAGVVVVAATSAGIQIKDQSAYPHIPDGSFLRAVEDHCDKVEFDDLQLGDLVMFKFEKEAQHIGIISNLTPLMMIHAWAQMRKVTENTLDGYWLKWLSGCYRIKM